MVSADEPDIRRYLAELQAAVGRGEIDTEDFDALAEEALQRAERGEPLRPPTMDAPPPGSLRRRSVRPTRNPRARRILTGFFIFWAAAFLLNVTVLAVLFVIAVGTGKLFENGKVHQLDVKKGDRVLFGKYAGTEIKVEGVEHLILREEEILGVVEK